MTWYLGLAAFTTLAVALSTFSMFRVTRRRREPIAPACGRPAVSVLKPLCGADESLAANLETFFRQDYAPFELVFGVQGAEDPAIAVVRRLRSRYPEVDCRVVIHDGHLGLNPKVANLRAIVEAGVHDVVVVSDSNVAVDRDYLRNQVAHLLSTPRVGPRVGLVTNLVAGVDEEAIGASLDNLHLNGVMAGSVAASQVLGRRTVAVGKSLMFRLSDFDALGGFESVAPLLAEDYVMGRMFQEGGFEVRLADSVVRNVNRRTSLAGFLSRQLRWGLLRSRLNPLVYPLELLINPMAVALAAPLFGLALAGPLTWAAAVGILRDAVQTWRLRGGRGLWHLVPLSPIKDALQVVVWALAPLYRHVVWRGRRYRVSSGTRLYAEHDGGGRAAAPRHVT